MGLIPKATPTPKVAVTIPKVAVVKGSNRKENIKKALELIEDDIEKAVKEKRKERREEKSKEKSSGISDILFVKINAIDIKFPLACTHPEALEAVLEFFYGRFGNKLNRMFERIIVGDNTYAFSNLSPKVSPKTSPKVSPKDNPYAHLKERFEEIEFSDLTEFGFKKIDFKSVDGSSREAYLSLLPEKAFTISLALPKTHDAVVFTGCSKNMLGCVTEGRTDVHGTGIVGRFTTNLSKSISVTHENLATVIANAKPDLAVLDGFVGMEGEGPLLGSEIELGLSLASTDSVALDALGARIAGFDTVPYLSISAGRRLDSIGMGLNSIITKTEIVKEGFENLDDVSKKFKAHHLYKYQTLEKTRSLPVVDFRLLFSVLRRPHRIIPKIIKMINAR